MPTNRGVSVYQFVFSSECFVSQFNRLKNVPYQHFVRGTGYDSTKGEELNPKMLGTGMFSQ